MKKTLALAVLAVLFSAGFSFAEESTGMDYELSVSGISQYIGSVTGGTFHDKSVIQSSFTVLHNPSGLYLNLWGSYSPSGGFNSDYGDEVDYIIGINRNVGPVNIDFYYAYYNLWDLSKHGPGDIHSLGTKLKFPKVWELSPYLMAEYYFVRACPEDNGLAFRVGADFAPIKKLENLKVDVSIAGHTEMFGAKAEPVSSAKVSVRYEVKLTEKLSLTPEVKFQKRLGYHAGNSGSGITQDRIWGGLTLKISF